MANPDHYQAAILLHRQGRLAEAERSYRAALRQSPRHAGVLQGLGVVCVHGGRIAEAAEFFRQATDAAPRDAALHCYLGLTLSRLGRHDEAAGAFQTALRHAPGHLDALTGLGNACLMLGRYEKARQFFEQALAARTGHIPALMGLGDSFSILGLQREAQAAFDGILTLKPDHAPAHFGRGAILRQQGRAAEARQAFAHAIALAPKVAAYHRALAEIERFTDDDPRLAALEQLARGENELSENDRVELNFALAKAYDDLKRHGPAMERLQKGNSIKRRNLEYDEAAVMESFHDFATSLTPAMPPGGGHPSGLPVFIVGMPRSGTSLVEQILASHPQVFGAGELLFLPDLIADGEAGRDYPAAPPSAAALRRLGARYVERLAALAPQARRITDKLPANFRHLGLIHRALPQARLIHVRRDPVDTCFSCYSKLFLNGLNYTYDLGELGRYYKAYETLMAHWRSVLPQSALLDVTYEELVKNFETQARTLIGFCGLEWDARCLAFHRNERAVRTLSDNQVRQPLYSDAIGRSRPYRDWLKPLLNALDR